MSSLRKREFLSQQSNIALKNVLGITISSNKGGWSINGKLTNKFSYSLEAKWGDLFASLVPGAELLQKTGDASLTTGVFSKKYYQGGNHLNFTAEFRVFDDGTSIVNPVLDAQTKLVNMTVSNEFSTNTAGRQAIMRLKGVFGQFKDALKGGNTTQDIIDNVKNALETFTSTDREVTVNINKVFRCSKMIITTVTPTLSNELTHTGPLYGDFSVGLMSIEAIVRGSGLTGVDNIFKRRPYLITRNGSEEIISAELQ